ncbi:hypothetical protein DUNSADRAFT_12474 [Dunaliella salina]|uniref:Encoded protein n=1 Tax=Dunaliella salina TaxID=3046 RepID=A0ABQ7H408_DUNSA|nr:hypothetical protein DUNSADRAFT_12474 [Dunaliella salina]|eukprot:KAF5841546.1 hypothetical protein DUNSADRAFT_12474 [Dunaliella salina]
MNVPTTTTTCARLSLRKYEFCATTRLIQLRKYASLSKAIVGMVTVEKIIRDEAAQRVPNNEVKAWNW